MTESWVKYKLFDHPLTLMFSHHKEIEYSLKIREEL